MSDSTANLSTLLRRSAAPMAWAILGLGAIACSSTKASTSTGDTSGVSSQEGVASSSKGELSELAQPTPEHATAIAVKSYEVQAIRSGDEWVRLFEWFQGQGELAYPKLLEMAAGDHTGAMEFAMSVLAARGDSRLMPYFKREVPEPSPDDVNLYFGYHRALLAMGELSSVPVMIDGMEEDNVKKRGVAYRALELATHNGLHFNPNGTPEERAESIQAWREWYEAQSSDPLLRS